MKRNLIGHLQSIIKTQICVTAEKKDWVWVILSTVNEVITIIFLTNINTQELLLLDTQPYSAHLVSQSRVLLVLLVSKEKTELSK